MSRVRVVFRDNPVLTLNRKRAAEVLFRGKMLEPPKREASRFTEAIDQHENTILHVCEMILQFWGRETDLSLVMSALSNVVPALKMWGKFLDLLYRVNSDDIDIEQFETLCKMLKWSVGMGFASSSMGFKNGKGCTQAICGCVTKYVKLFWSCLNPHPNVYMVAALAPVILKFESLPTQALSTEVVRNFKLLSEYMSKAIKDCTLLTAFDDLAHSIVVCAKLGRCMAAVDYDIAQFGLSHLIMT